MQNVLAILMACDAFGEGGWRVLEPVQMEWILIVQGMTDADGEGEGGDLEVDLA